MNTVNNKRRRESVSKIEKAFMELLQTKELKEISVSDICKMTQLNRSTFYANFIDIYDLADKLCDKLEKDFSTLFADDANSRINTGAVRMFTHIKENQLFYKTYFKLDYDKKHEILTYDTNRANKDFGGKNLDYHITFFRNGLNAMIKMWLDNGCKESPEEIDLIIKNEYKKRIDV